MVIWEPGEKEDSSRFRIANAIVFLAAFTILGCSSGTAEHQGINASVIGNGDDGSSRDAQTKSKLARLEGTETPDGEVTDLPGFTKNQAIQNSDPITADQIETDPDAPLFDYTISDQADGASASFSEPVMVTGSFLTNSVNSSFNACEQQSYHSQVPTFNLI